MDQVSELLQRTRQDPSSLTALVGALQALLQAGHVGNRTVARGDVWGVVVAATRAFPIQLSPSVEKAQEVLAAADSDTDDGSSLLHTWILQAAADGSLPVLVQKLCSQPQILTAYARDAPLRQPATVDALVAALQELQALIPVSPYDSYMQAKKAAATAAAGQAAPDQTPPAVHIQTESDLVQQQQLPSPSSSTNADAQSGHSSSSGSNNGSGQASAAGASSSLAAASQPTGEQKGFVGRLRSARMPQFGSFSKKGLQQQQQHGGTGWLQVQLLVATPEQLSSAPDRLVQLHVQVTQQQQQQQQPDTRQQQKHSAGSNANNSSRGTASPAAPSSVKGLLQGLQQSAASGLQQAAATAAGQDISGAVAAAGGAVAAALGSVKGWNRFEGGRRQQQQQGAEAAAGSGTESSRSSSSRRQAGGRQPAKRPPTAAAAAGVAKDSEWRRVAVQLLLRAAEDAAAHGPVQLQLNVLPGPPPAAAAASDTKDAGWSTRGVLDRLRLPRGSAGAGSSNSSSSAPSQHEVAVEALSIEQEGQEQQVDADALLEGDMWSVMSRLKAGSSSVLAARAGDDPAAEAAEAAAQQLAASAQLLQQQLASCCSAVCAAAARSKGSLGEESPELLQLIDLIKQLLSHGLNNSGGSSSSSSTAQTAGANSSSSKGSTPEPGSMAAAVKVAVSARDMLSGLLMQGRQQSAFGVLQALQHGRQQQPRLMLGADGIANMKEAKSAPPAVKLDLWVRASLNEQLLGVRISTLLANPDALTPWYHPGALLLQHGGMAAVMQELQELLLYRFALPVDAAAAVAAATAGAAGDSAPVQQQQGAGMAAAASSRSSSMTAALDPRKYLGGFSVGLGSLRASSTTAAAAAPPTAAAAAPPTAGSSGSNAAPSSSSVLPTFLWGPDGGGSSTSSGPAAAPASTAGSAGAAAATAAAAAAATAATGGFFRRRRVPQIKEVRVPPPGSGAVLSREPSSTLSPVSTEGDTAYAEWWSPNNSTQDLQAAAVDGGGRRFGSSNSLRSSGGSSGALGGDGGGTPRSPTFVNRSASRRSHAGSEASTGATSEAALQLEQDLQAAMCAPLLVEQQLSAARRSGSGSGVGAGAIRRSGSAGWDAAVARAKSTSAAAGPLTVGLGSLSRRSRSPEAALGSSGGGSSGVGGGGRRSRHMHKRSSSLNDLPELEALWMDGGAGGGA